MKPVEDITSLLAAARQGDIPACDRAFSLLYAELGRLARAKLRAESTFTNLDEQAVRPKEAMSGLRAMACVAALACGGCVGMPGGFYDSAPLDDPVLGACVWTGKYTSFVYTESDHIRAYFEPTNLAAYRQAIGATFTMPERPLIRVSVLDFYGMENGPAYRETEISVAVLHDGAPGWLILTMPVTDGDSCFGGRNFLGTPKVVRHITLERQADRYVGTSYARGGRAPELTLAVDVVEPGTAAREVLRTIASFSEIYILKGRVVKYPGRRAPVYDLERAAPAIWSVRLGRARMEVSGEPDNLLQRLGVGAPLAAYWGQRRQRYSLVPGK